MKKVIYSLFTLPLALTLWSFGSNTPEPKTKIELGERLFFDKILSEDKTISCATCHIPEFAFADTSAVSKGVGGKVGTRNTPSSMNMGSRPYFFYDGRAATLEEQVLHPVKNPVEMNLAIPVAVTRIQGNALYRKWFKQLYHQQPDSIAISDALAQYVRSLESPGDAAADQWVNDIDPKAMTESQIRGRQIFMKKAKCFDCHFSPDFTGDEFRNIGLYDGDKLNDKGRFDATKNDADLGKFKVPGLRNIAVTAPYMHNGMFKTLREVVEYYDNPDKFVAKPINRDTLLQKPLGLSEQEKTDIVNFLEALTDKRYVKK